MELNNTQTALAEWVTLIENTTKSFQKHFAQMVVLYESSDPASSIITNEALLEFKNTKGDILKHISGLSLLTELKKEEQLKLVFQLMYLIDTFQNPLRQMRSALDNPRIKSSITSSDNIHLNQSMTMLHMIFNHYISHSYKIQQNCYNLILHDIFTSDVNWEKLPEELKKLDKKYPVVSFYSAILHYIFKHNKSTILIENVEELKDRILDTISLTSEHPFTFQMFDLIGSAYTTLDKIFSLTNREGDLTKISKQLSVDDKQFDIVVITQPTEYVYNPWNITQKIEYDSVTQETIQQFKTIEPVESKVKLDMKIYSYLGNKKKVTKKYYYILQTYDGIHYRAMIPWQIYPPESKFSELYIPQSWLPGLEEFMKTGKNYPSGRVATYNKIIEKEILKYKGEEKEVELEVVDVTNERGFIVDKLSTWFLDLNKKMPNSLSEYRSLINSDEFHDYIEQILTDILFDKYKKDLKSELTMTIYSTASILMRRISREILGITTKSTTLRNIYDTYTQEKIINELPTIFKTQIKQCIDIVVSYESLFSSIDRKKLIYQD